MRRYLTILPLLIGGLLATGAHAATSAPQTPAAATREGNHSIVVRISDLLHAVGFARTADSRDIRPTRANYIDLLEQRTYLHAYGCHDLRWMMDYLAQRLEGTGAIHSHNSFFWRWQVRDEHVVLELNYDHCRWEHPGGPLSARVWIVRFMPSGR